MDAIAEFEINVRWTINVLHPILCIKQSSLMKTTMNVKGISVLSEKPFKERLRTILETSNIKSMRSALNFQSIFGL